MLPAMSHAIRRRGPDGAGEFRDDAAGIGLVHRRLAILDLSEAGAQPLADTEDRAVLVYNGEIYNFLELRRELERDGFRFRGHSDSEVLVNLYLRDGTAMLPRLNGIFAFALWDRRKRELFVARDRFGVKPLYVTSSASGFAFASEIKALLPILEDRELDRTAIRRYLSFLYCPGDRTPFRAVRKLGPGEALTVKDGKIVRTHRWFVPPQQREVQTPPITDERTAASLVEGALSEAVRRQLVADVPVGAFLSGGVDSSAVVAFARKHVPDIRCFTIDVVGGQDAGTVDDLPFAQQAARHLGVKLETIRVASSAMAADLPRMVELLDEPLADPAPLNALYISQLAREHGIKVLLSGAGGDDLFSGYRRHLLSELAGPLSLVPSGVRRLLGRVARRLDLRDARQRKAAKALGILAHSGDDATIAAFEWIDREEVDALVGGRSPEALLDEPLRTFLRDVRVRHPLERMLSLEQRFFLTDHNLTYTDKMGMAVGVEARVPFLDNDLVELAARLSPSLKQRRLDGKWILKRALEPHLPASILHRPKTGFGAPLRRWIQADLREMVEDLLSRETVSRRGLFDADVVQGLLRRQLRGTVDASYTVLSLMCIELWCRSFIDQKALP